MVEFVGHLQATEQINKEVEDVFAQAKDGDVQAVFIVLKTAQNEWRTHYFGREHELGTAASILQAEHSKVWNHYE